MSAGVRLHVTAWPAMKRGAVPLKLLAALVIAEYRVGRRRIRWSKLNALQSQIHGCIRTALIEQAEHGWAIGGVGLREPGRDIVPHSYGTGACPLQIGIRPRSEGGDIRCTP